MSLGRANQGTSLPRHRRVSDVLDLFAAGLSADEVLAELPDLEPADLSPVSSTPPVGSIQQVGTAHQGR